MQEVNLSQFDVETPASEGAKLHLLNKRGEPSGEWIQLLGVDSKAYQERLAEHNRRRLLRLQKPNAPRISHAEMEAETIDRLVTCTKDWSFKAEDGQKIPLTPQTVEGVYRHSILIREQVEAFINERSNFTQA